ncbi:hypothetical protein Hte_005581 [Hypoxylon texense]
MASGASSGTASEQRPTDKLLNLPRRTTTTTPTLPITALPLPKRLPWANFSTFPVSPLTPGFPDQQTNLAIHSGTPRFIRIVRRVVPGEAEASDIVRALISKDYAKIVDTYADEDFTVVKEEIQSICGLIRDQKRSGAWFVGTSGR